MSVCPGCGRCSHCGHGTAARPYFPYPHWTYPNSPYWYQGGFQGGQINTAGTTTTTVGTVQSKETK